MSGIVISTDIPTNINKLTKLLTWGVLLANDLYRGVTYKESTGDGVDSGLAPVCDASIVTTADGKKTLIGRIAIPLDDAYVTGSAKLWEYAQDWGSAIVPAAYKSN